MKRILRVHATCAFLLICSIARTIAVPVTFVVDMQQQIAQGNFNPATGIVTVHGSFSGWVTGTTLTNAPSDTNIYMNSINVPGSPGTVFEYKFVYNNNDLVGDHWESPSTRGGGNRAWDLANHAETLFGVYFSDISLRPPQFVTFQVEMQLQVLAGNFNPATDSVQARGSFQMPTNWSGTEFVLTNSPARPTLYTGTYGISNTPPNTQFDYKFVYIRAGVVNWDQPTTGIGYFSNRFRILSPGLESLPVVFFSDYAGVTPAITTQPTSRVGVIGSSVAFTAAASGTTPLYFSWYHTNLQSQVINFPVQTNALLLLTNIQMSDFGSYVLQVSNAAGVTFSSPASLTIATNPVISGVTKSGTTFIFNFLTEPGLTYVVEYKNDLNDIGWQFLTSYAGNGSQFPVTDNIPTTNRSRFYRLRLQ